MIFNQFFDEVSCTYTYLISSGKGREALIIDPVIEKTDEYISYLKNLDLKLVKVIDTHIHADHVSGLKELQEKTDCVTIMGEKSLSEIVSIHVKDIHPLSHWKSTAIQSESPTPSTHMPSHLPTRP